MLNTCKEEIITDRVKVFSHIEECRRTRTGMGIVQTGKGSIQLVMYDDQLCVCGTSQAEMEMELSLWYGM